MAEEDGDSAGRRFGRNLQGLLKFCTEMTVKEDASGDSHLEPLDAERKAFLENVMSDIQGGAAKKFVLFLEQLSQECVFDYNGDYTDAEDALAELEDYVDDINYATDLYKIGGFPVLIKCLESPHIPIRTKAAEVIGEASQNTVELQKAMVELDALSKLLAILDGDEDICRRKALFAISCIVRDCDTAVKTFLSLNGLSYLMRAMESGIEKLEVKAVFLINSLSQEDEFRSCLTSVGFVDLLLSIIVGENTNNTYREHCSQILLTLVKESDEARQQCSNFSVDVVPHLRRRLEEIADKDENQEEAESLSSLITILEKKPATTSVDGGNNNEHCLR